MLKSDRDFIRDLKNMYVTCKKNADTGLQCGGHCMGKEDVWVGSALLWWKRKGKFINLFELFKYC